MREPAFVRVVRCGRAHVMRFGDARLTSTTRLPRFTAADIETAWLAEYRAVREQCGGSVRP